MSRFIRVEIRVTDEGRVLSVERHACRTSEPYCWERLIAESVRTLLDAEERGSKESP